MTNYESKIRKIIEEYIQPTYVGMKFSNPRTELIYQDLKSRYNRATLNKNELANEFGLSVSTIDLYMQKGLGIPNYKKLGTAKNAKVVFSIIDVAEYLSQTIRTN